MSTNKDVINHYFYNFWNGGRDPFQYSNIFDILEKIKPDESVIDIGCGYNPFKPYLNERLYSIDPAIPHGDELVDIESFDPKGRTWDIALCLGSINFGGETTIKEQIQKTVSILNPGGLIIWRQNPGSADHYHPECKDIPFFDWSIDKNYEYAREFNCSVSICTEEYNSRGIRRIYSEWIKK